MARDKAAWPRTLQSSSSGTRLEAAAAEEEEEDGLRWGEKEGAVPMGRGGSFCWCGKGGRYRVGGKVSG